MVTKVYFPAKGFDRNPLCSRKRNDVCICGSGKKFKKCCMDKIHKIIPENLCKEMKKQENINSAIILYYYYYNKELITEMILKKQIKHKYVPESIWLDIKKKFELVEDKVKTLEKKDEEMPSLPSKNKYT